MPFHVCDTDETVFVVDDDASVCRSLKRLLNSCGYQARTFSTPEDFLQSRSCNAASCLILDLQLHDATGLQLQEALAAASRQIPIVFLSGHADIPSSVCAMKAGAVDFLRKPCRDDELLAAVAQALGKDRAARKERAEVTAIQQRLASLTPREFEVLRHVISGKINKQIAAQLATQIGTIKAHRGQIMKKLCIQSVAELVLLAIRMKIEPAHDAPNESTSSGVDSPHVPK